MTEARHVTQDWRDNEEPRRAKQGEQDETDSKEAGLNWLMLEIKKMVPKTT